MLLPAEVRRACLRQDRTSRLGDLCGLFLADGSPHGLIVAEIGNWSGKVLSGPRGRIAELLRRPEASRTGIYMQIGPDPDRPGELLGYIGEADDVAARMRHHLRSDSKDFFDRVAFVVGSDDALTKAHARYLESRLIRLTKEAGTVTLTNDTAPAGGRDRRPGPGSPTSEAVDTVAELCAAFERLRRRHLRLGRLLRKREIEAVELNSSSRGRITTDMARERVGYHDAWPRWSESYDDVALAADRLLGVRPQSLADVVVMFGALEWLLLSDAVIVDRAVERQVHRFSRGLRQLAAGP